METKKQYVSNRPAISMKELKKMFQYMTEDELEKNMQENEWIKLDKFLEHVGQKNEQYRRKAEQPDVVRLEINVEWKKSRTWGQNPHAYWHAELANGHWLQGHETCGGCGYDKESTVVAEIFKQACSGMLWRKRKTKKKAPYGIRFGWFPSFEGGVGISCYFSIVEFLGGKMERVASGKTYDNYVVKFPVKKQKVA